MNTNTKNIVLQTEDLSIGYQQKKSKSIIAEHLNLTIEKGKFIAVLGENGVGKSTLLRTISNVQAPLSGNIYLNGKNSKNYNNKELATCLSLVLTERFPESQFTVFELIALGRQPYTNWIDTITDRDVEKINWAIEITEVQELKDKKFYELSDGQLQRVLIARALAQDTELIVLDEPTAHLDIHHTYKIFQLLKKLVQTTKKTIFISTHQVNLALGLVDELILMNSTEVIYGKTPDLIEANHLDNLFPKDILQFNKTLEQFTITKDN